MDASARAPAWGDTAHGVLVRTTSGAGQEIGCSLHPVCSPRATFGGRVHPLEVSLDHGARRIASMVSASLAHGPASAAGMSASSFKARRAPAIATLTAGCR